jgi:pimeloyl-ACP methyl ester carboxylesterase
MKKLTPIKLLLIIAILCLCVGLAGLIVLNRGFADQQLVTFSDPARDSLTGTYHPGTENIGVILLEGFGSDQIGMRPAASVFMNAGAHILTFDFSGHGRSPGGLGFDNASTDRLATQVLAAMKTFRELSGLMNDQIILFGHSLGARVALQAALLDPSPPAALVLLGTQVNLGTNVQAEFFTGTSDADLDWVQSLSAANPAIHILLLSGSWDDILTPAAADALFEKLTTGSTAVEGSAARELTIIPNLVHNYEIYSVRLIKEAAGQLQELGVMTFSDTISFSGYYLFGGLFLFGLFASLILAPLWLRKQLPISPSAPLPAKIQRLKRFLWAKLWLWLGAIPAAVLLTGLFFIFPLYLPVFNLIYVGFIGGYGVLMLVLYLLGRIPGTEGKWKLKRSNGHKSFSLRDSRFWMGILVWILILSATIIFTRSGLFYVIAPNQRLVWLVVFTPVTALGFWIGAREARMLEVFRHESGRRLRWTSMLLSLIGLMPFFIYTILMGVLGSLSGMIGGLQGLLILGLVLLAGKVINQFIHKPCLVSLLQAVLLYALILPQGVLFAF